MCRLIDVIDILLLMMGNMYVSRLAVASEQTHQLYTANALPEGLDGCQ